MNKQSRKFWEPPHNATVEFVDTTTYLKIKRSLKIKAGQALYKRNIYTWTSLVEEGHNYWNCKT